MFETLPQLKPCNAGTTMDLWPRLMGQHFCKAAFTPLWLRAKCSMRCTVDRVSKAKNFKKGMKIETDNGHAPYTTIYVWMLGDGGRLCLHLESACSPSDTGLQRSRANGGVFGPSQHWHQRQPVYFCSCVPAVCSIAAVQPQRYLSGDRSQGTRVLGLCVCGPDLVLGAGLCAGDAMRPCSA